MVAKKHHKKLFSRAGTEKQTRSLFGNAVLFIILAAFGAFMILPLFYSVINSFKPIEELFLYPPRFYVMRPVFSNYTSLFRLINNLRVPFSRYAFNSVFVCVVITAGSDFNSLGCRLFAFKIQNAHKLVFPGGCNLAAFQQHGSCNTAVYYSERAGHCKYILGVYTALACLITRAVSYEAVYGAGAGRAYRGGKN